MAFKKVIVGTMYLCHQQIVGCIVSAKLPLIEALVCQFENYILKP